jgi:hypothetical protein
VAPRGDYLVKIGERTYVKPYVEDKFFSLFK